jgi:hypothetical protein
MALARRSDTTRRLLILVLLMGCPRCRAAITAAGNLGRLVLVEGVANKWDLGIPSVDDHHILHFGEGRPGVLSLFPKDHTTVIVIGQISQ